MKKTGRRRSGFKQSVRQKLRFNLVLVTSTLAVIGAIGTFLYLNTGVSEKTMASGSSGGFTNNVGMENGSTEWSFSGASAFSVTTVSTEIRSGSKALKMTTSGTLDSKAFDPALSVMIPATGTNYITVLAWMKSNTTNGDAAVGIYNTNTSVTTKSPTVTNISTSWQKISYTFPATNGQTYYPVLFGRSTNTTSKSIFYDDVVIYTSTLGSTDAGQPFIPSAVSITSTGTTISLSWTPGTDAGGSGIDGYLVLRYAGVKLTDTVVDNQVNYSTNNIYGPNAIGSWQVVYSGLSPSFIDNPGSTGNYTYMMYTRDKAFNYSMSSFATRAIVMNGTSTYTTVASYCYVDGIFVGPGNTLTISTGTTIELWTGAIGHIHGTVIDKGYLFNNGANLVFYNGSVYRYNKNGSSVNPVVPATWSNGSECRLDGITNTLPGGLYQNFYNFTMNNTLQTSALSFVPNFICNNDFTVQSTGTSALTLFSSTIGGDLYKTGGTVSFNSSSALTMNGSASQVITLPSTLSKLIVNNPAGIVFSTSVTVNDSLKLLSGTITTDVTNKLTLGATGVYTGGSASSYVNGPMIKTGSTAFSFPVGASGIYKPISISANGSITTQFRAQYVNANPNTLYNISLKDPAINNVSKCEYWKLDVIAGTPSVRPTIRWDVNSCGVNDTSFLTVARWNGTMWADERHGTVTGNITAGYITSSNLLSTFGPITLASYNGINPLPVTLTRFTIACEEGLPVLKWATASELNNDYFTIERSTDAKFWVPVGRKDGQGNSTVLVNYEFIDLYPEKNSKSYYHLKQTDYNGKFEIFGPLTFSCNEKVNADLKFTAFQDADNQLVVRLNSDAPQDAKITLFTADGRLLYSSTVSLTEGSNEIPLPEARITSKGLYVISIYAGNIKESKKIFLK